MIGKAGRADTPTDPAPLDMVETFVNFRPKELWPKRVLRYADAKKQTDLVLTALEAQGYVQPAASDDDRKSLINDASQKALERFDETMRELALLRYTEFERQLGTELTRFAVADVVRRMQEGGHLVRPGTIEKQERATQEIDRLAAELAPRYAAWLAESRRSRMPRRYART